MTTFNDTCTHEALFGATEDTVQGGEWATPQTFFNALDEEFHFTLDAAASAENTKCLLYYDKAANGLLQPWATHVVFCNPPYGKEIKNWLAKGQAEAAKGATVVFLIHARTDTRWFHEYVYKVADEVRFVKGRLKFVHPDGRSSSAPFPSMVVIYRPTKN